MSRPAIIIACIVSVFWSFIVPFVAIAYVLSNWGNPDAISFMPVLMFPLIGGGIAEYIGLEELFPILTFLFAAIIVFPICFICDKVVHYTPSHKSSGKGRSK